MQNGSTFKHVDKTLTHSNSTLKDDDIHPLKPNKQTQRWVKKCHVVGRQTEAGFTDRPVIFLVTYVEL